MHISATHCDVNNGKHYPEREKPRPDIRTFLPKWQSAPRSHLRGAPDVLPAPEAQVRRGKAFRTTTYDPLRRPKFAVAGHIGLGNVFFRIMSRRDSISPDVCIRFVRAISIVPCGQLVRAEAEMHHTFPVYHDFMRPPAGSNMLPHNILRQHAIQAPRGANPRGGAFAPKSTHQNRAVPVSFLSSS